MQLPRVHLNGTSRSDLIDENDAARTAVRRAITALNQSAPNGRDFYPIGDGAFTQAQDEHVARVAKLEAVLGELNDIRNHLG